MGRDRVSLLEPRSVDEILQRVDELRDLNQPHLQMRRVTRAILNGGADAVAHLVADSEMEHLPAANLMHSALERLAQKLGKPPSVRVDSPITTDSARARKSAEKRERIVESYDAASNLEMQMPQMARWVPGYGFGVWTIQAAQTTDGQPFPSLELRDPYGCLPGPWTVHQQPDDLAFVRRIPEPLLRRIWPNLPRNLRPRRYSTGGAVILDNTQSGKWGNQGDNDLIRVIEYRNHAGTYMILEDAEILLDFEPSPSSVGTPFVVAKRFAFDELIGQYEHVKGLQQMLTRLNVLAFLAVQDAVFSETNIYGEMLSDEYRRGRGATNHFEQGTRVERPTDGQVFQSFQQQDRLERQLRLTGAYPVTDDAQSPNSFVTGQGLRELTQSADNAVQEHQTIFKHALQIADRKRLAWDEEMWGGINRVMPGYHDGAPYVEKYRPDRDIDGNHLTRRAYGLLSGLDSSSKLIGLLQISQAGWMDDITAMEHLDGIDNVQQVRERLDQQQSEELLQQALLGLAQGQPTDDRVLRVLIDGLEEGPRKQRFENIFFPEPETDPETGEEVPVEGQREALAQPGEDPQTIMSRLFGTGGGNAQAQLVQTQ